MIRLSGSGIEPEMLEANNMAARAICQIRDTLLRMTCDGDAWFTSLDGLMVVFQRFPLCKAYVNAYNLDNSWTYVTRSGDCWTAWSYNRRRMVGRFSLQKMWKPYRRLKVESFAEKPRLKLK